METTFNQQFPTVSPRRVNAVKCSVEDALSNGRQITTTFVSKLMHSEFGPYNETHEDAVAFVLEQSAPAVASFLHGNKTVLPGETVPKEPTIAT